MNEDLKEVSLPGTILIASLILGGSIIFSAKLVSRNLEKAVAKLRQDLLVDIKKMEQARVKEMQPEPAKPEEKIVKGVTSGSNPIKGNPAAPVLLVEFSDFECPFSKRFYQQTFPSIDKEYISTGKVKFAYRDFPLPMHPLAKDAAIACRCAGKQNKYWEMFDKLSHTKQLEQAQLTDYAKELKLNMKSFDACRKDETIANEVDKDFSEGANFGVRGTPAFFINGRLIEGARPFETFKEIIENEIKSSEGKK